MSKIRQQIAAKQAEMRILKLEEETINKLSTQINDQLNRLKIEAMSFNSAIVDKNVKNAIQPSTSLDETTSEQISLISPANMSVGVEPQVDIYIPEQPQQVNLMDLDLLVPPTGTKCSYTFDEESSDEDEEANECLLQL